MSIRPPFQVRVAFDATRIGPNRLPPLKFSTENTEFVANVTLPELMITVSVLVGTCAGLQFALFVQKVETAPVQVIVVACALVTAATAAKQMALKFFIRLGGWKFNRRYNVGILSFKLCGGIIVAARILSSIKTCDWAGAAGKGFSDLISFTPSKSRLFLLNRATFCPNR